MTPFDEFLSAIITGTSASEVFSVVREVGLNDVAEDEVAKLHSAMSLLRSGDSVGGKSLLEDVQNTSRSTAKDVARLLLKLVVRPLR
jgi:hypothetical protein